MNKLAVAICLLSCGCSAQGLAEEWRSTPRGAGKIELAKRLIEENELIGLSSGEMKRMLGEAAEDEERLSYILELGNSTDPLTTVTLLVCTKDAGGHVASCMIQKD